LYYKKIKKILELKIKYPHDKEKQIGKDFIYKFIYEKRKDLIKYLRYQKDKYRRRYGTGIKEKEREKLKKEKNRYSSQRMRMIMAVLF